jgi:restriction system protein
MADHVAVPQYHDLMWPALEATRELGGSARNAEMAQLVIGAMGLTAEQQAVMHNERMTEIEYRLHWARNHLKNIGAMTNSARGVWSLSEVGERMTEPEMMASLREYRAELTRRHQERVAQRSRNEGETEDEDVEATTWKEQTLALLLTIPPDGFERLAQRLLREAGFVNVAVTGRSGDGGIDGLGLYRPSLVSFPVYFQCKRYQGSVGPSVVRDFRGAMAGRGEKGLLITTGAFSRDAVAEANRDGAPPVELIDGEYLCDLLKEYGLGVQVTQRIVEDVEVVPSFFEEFRA